MERFGLIGLPNAGKSSLYNALTGGGALVTAYPFSTKDSNVGVAKLPDHRLDALADRNRGADLADQVCFCQRRAGVGQKNRRSIDDTRTYKLTTHSNQFTWQTAGQAMAQRNKRLRQSDDAAP